MDGIYEGSNPLVREKVRGKWKVYFRGQVYNVGTKGCLE